MPLLPPELARPYRNATERATATSLLARRGHTLRTIENLARKPTSSWSPSEFAAFPHTTNGVADPPPARLERWTSIFADELAAVHRLAADHRPRSDVELREALYLAARLLSTVTDQPIDHVDHVDQFTITQ